MIQFAGIFGMDAKAKRPRMGSQRPQTESLNL